MKKIISMIVTVLILATMLPTNLFAAGSDIIPNDETGIPDKILYKAVLTALNKKSGTFTKAEAETIKDIWANKESKTGTGIKSLKGIGNVPNLELLCVSGNAITDLSGIEELSNLKSLYAGDNKLKDISGIEKLNKLMFFEVSNNNLTNLNGIENLTELVGVIVHGNKLTSLPDLTKLVKLESNDNNTTFVFNKIPEKEIRDKLPKQLFEDSKWLKTQIKLQNHLQPTLKLLFPSKVTKKTKKIKIKVINNSGVNLVLSQWNGKQKIKPIKVNPNKKNIAVFRKLKLKKCAGKKIEIKCFIQGIKVKNLLFKIN